jgi:hypothetical protein
MPFYHDQTFVDHTLFKQYLIYFLEDGCDIPHVVERLSSLLWYIEYVEVINYLDDMLIFIIIRNMQDAPRPLGETYFRFLFV